VVICSRTRGQADSREDVMEPFPHYYSVTAAAGGQGEISLESRGVQPLRSAAPRQFGGPGNLWSPETLLVGAVADCFVLTFRAVAGLSRLDWVSISCDVEGTVERIDSVTRFTRVVVRPRLRMAEGSDPTVAYRVLARTEQNCLVTRSLNADVQFEPDVEVTGGGVSRDVAELAGTARA
jgi:organic hydroperoxide reductase OsmC/OhrA